MTSANNAQGTNGHTKKKRINQFGDDEDVQNMTVDDWNYRWNRQQTKFHLECVNPQLITHYEVLTRGKSNRRIFLPLCGKSVDMKWLLDKGHEVVGNEAVDSGCRQFFEENNIPYETSPIPGINGVVYRAKNKDQRISLYRCDFFDLSPDICGQFDAIWDRGSLVAVAVTQRRAYSSLISKLMRNDCSYLLDAFRVAHDVFAGPPFDCKEEDLKELFHDKCTVNKLSSVDALTDWQRSWGLTVFTEEVYQLELKGTHGD